VRLHRTSEVEGLEGALGDAGVEREGRGLLFAARAARDDGWEAVERELLSAFTMTQDAFVAEEPIVYLVRQADLLGQDGAPGAMLATALLSAARALAMEDRDGVTCVNVLAYDDAVDVPGLADWIGVLLARPDVTGELIRLGRSHLGRLLP